MYDPLFAKLDAPDAHGLGKSNLALMIQINSNYISFRNKRTKVVSSFQWLDLICGFDPVYLGIKPTSSIPVHCSPNIPKNLCEDPENILGMTDAAFEDNVNFS